MDSSCSWQAVSGRGSARDALTFVHGYPASQAALARLDPHDPRTALRFELYCDGIELANGFHELAARRASSARASSATMPSGGGARPAVAAPR